MATRLGVFLHEILVERFDLGDIVLDPGAERSDSEMIRSFLLSESGPGDRTDPGGIYSSATANKETTAVAVSANKETGTLEAPKTRAHLANPGHT